MNDNQVIAALIIAIRAGLNSFGLTNVGIRQSYQPRQNGVEIEPTVYLHKITAQRWGWTGRKDVFNSNTSMFDHTDVHYRSATFQIDGLSTQDPADISQLTASDIVECTADALQTLTTIESLSEQRIRIERITQIRERYFTDDRDRHEQRPSFDFTVTYMVNRAAIVPPVSESTCTLHRI